MSIGPIEILIVFLVGLCIAAVVVLVVLLRRAPFGTSERLAALEAEVRRLRADLDKLKK